MPEIGIRELKNQATEIIRKVREAQAEYVVTYRGKPVAMILPYHATYLQPTRRVQHWSDEEFWAEWEELAREIDEEWQSRESALETLFEMRQSRDQTL